MRRSLSYWIPIGILFCIVYGWVLFRISLLNNIQYILPYHLVYTIATQVALFYLIGFYLFERLYKRKRVTYVVTSGFLILYLIPVVRLIAMVLADVNVTFSRVFTLELLVTYLITFAILFITIAIRLLIDKSKEEAELREIERQKKDIELFALKNQIDSHFLFNTLNNLYGLALAKSDLAPKGILLLSDILSFVLYETKKEFYPLTSELNLINAYIELEKLRWGSNLQVNIEMSGKIEDAFLTPLLLFTFVENCFKHGIAKTSNNPWLNIKISVHSNEIVFDIENSIPNSNIDPAKNEKSGIGLENIKRRLSLLYPDSYFLSTKMGDNSFSVKLILSNN